MHEFKYVFGRGTKSNSKYECCMYATIQGMEQAIQSIDAFATDTVLQGQTYSSAKAFLYKPFDLWHKESFICVKN